MNDHLVAAAYRSKWHWQIVGLLAALFLLVAAVLPWSTALGAEEGEVAIKSMRVSIWPEYDDRRVLIMYQGELGSEVVYPQGVEFLAVKGAEINQVCAITTPAHEHLCQPYEAKEKGNYLSIAYKLPIPTFFLEYYYDGIRGETNREFNYEFESVHPIERLDIEVQQPLRSSSFALSLPGAAVSAGGDGFTYYRYSFNDVKPGQLIAIDTSYTKADSRPSVTAPANQPGSVSGSSNAPVAVGVTIAVVVVGGAGWYALSRRGSPVSRSGRAERRRAVRGGGGRPETAPPRHKAATAKVAFCHECGSAIADGDNFCSECGTKMRRS